VFEVDPLAHELRKQGVRFRLQAQPYQVLLLLLERAGKVVTRDELRQRIWPSSIFIDFDHGLNNAIARLREALGDDPATPRFIETLPRLGYRFVCPVEQVAPIAPVVAPVAAGDATRPWHTSRPAFIYGALGLFVASGLIVGLWLALRPTDDQAATTIAGLPSIAIVPFENLSDAADKEQFAIGFSQGLIDELAATRGMRVIGRTSAFSLRGKDLSPSAIGRKLNANYVLDGSVLRPAGRIQVSTRLIDARNARRVWSQTYKRDSTDLLRVQQEIAVGVLRALHIKLTPADEIRLGSRGTRDAEAYRLYTMGLTLLRGRGVARDPDRAGDLFGEALARDPQFAAAQAGVALVYFRDAWITNAATERSVRDGRAAAERAMTLDPESSEALLARASFEALQSRYQGDVGGYVRSQRDYRRALELDPTNSAIFFMFARSVFWDDSDLALNLLKRTVDLDPLWDTALALGAMLTSARGLHEAARDRLRELASHSLDPGLYKGAAGTLENQLGRLDEAVLYLRTPDASGGIQLWSVYLSLGDRAAARQSFEDLRGNELADILREAALHSMDGRFDEAFASLDRHCDDFPLSRLLDLPTARFALIADHAVRAKALLLRRLPDLVRGIEPVKARNVIPALDLVVAYERTGEAARAKQLLDRVIVFLDGAEVPRWPMFIYLRARAHALAGEPELALRTLERAYEAGFRLVWALDLPLQPLHYVDSIDSDPAFTSLRGDPRYRSWRQRISIDNAKQLERLRARDAAEAAGR